MGLQQWLGSRKHSQFVSEYYYKLPSSGSCVDPSDCKLGDWKVLESVVSAPDADVMFVRNGRRIEVQAATDDASLQSFGSARMHDTCSARRGSPRADKATGGVLSPRLSGTGQRAHVMPLRLDISDLTGITTRKKSSFCKPKDRRSIPLRKNTVNPWPLVEDMPNDLKYQREITPLMRLLAQGR